MNSNDCLEKQPLCDEMLTKMNAWWRAANYLAAGQLYLLDNPLLREPLKREHVKHKIVGHWGTVPGQNFVYTHLNRVIKRYDLDMIYISGPGHGGNFMVANTYMEGSYSEVYPNVSQDTEGMKKLFKQFSFPGGISSHVAPETPGSINEGGELGYSLAHAFGSVFDNPDLITACVVGDSIQVFPIAAVRQGQGFLHVRHGHKSLFRNAGIRIQNLEAIVLGIVRGIHGACHTGVGNIPLTHHGGALQHKAYPTAVTIDIPEICVIPIEQLIGGSMIGAPGDHN